MMNKWSSALRCSQSLLASPLALGLSHTLEVNMNQEAIAFLEKWIVQQQLKLGNGFGEGFLISAAAVIWEN
jgi:hypothetical protein